MTQPVDSNQSPYPSIPPITESSNEEEIVPIENTELQTPSVEDLANATAHVLVSMPLTQGTEPRAHVQNVLQALNQELKKFNEKLSDTYAKAMEQVLEDWFVRVSQELKQSKLARKKEISQWLLDVLRKRNKDVVTDKDTKEIHTTTEKITEKEYKADHPELGE